MIKIVQISYFSILREERGLDKERYSTEAKNAQELFHELKTKHGFSLDEPSVKVSINESVAPWDTPIKQDDHIVFIPPVSGG